MSQSPPDQPGVHWDPNQCAPYGSVSPYGYTCPCAYTYYPGYEYSYGYGYACPPEAGVRVLSKHSVARPKPAPAANENAATTTTTTVAEPESGSTTTTTVAEPASLPFTGESLLLVAVLGAGIAGAGVLVRRRV